MRADDGRCGLRHDRGVSLRTQDRLAVHELLALHGHLVDKGELDRLPEVFTDDVVYDLTALGGTLLTGIEAIREASLGLGEGNPVAHHVTNVVVVEQSGEVRAVSKFLGVRQDGTVGSGVYEDVLRHTSEGWRVASRRVSLRRQPLQP
jgi:3-phenylpropionate/cinnamic acid dioxygenase small subunit